MSSEGADLMNPESLAIAVVHVTLDRPRELRVSLRSMKRFATATGKDLFQGGPGADWGIEDVRAFVWSMARETDPKVTINELAAHISTAVFIQIAKAIRAIANGEPVSNQNESSNN